MSRELEAGLGTEAKGAAEVELAELRLRLLVHEDVSPRATVPFDQSLKGGALARGAP